MPLGILAKKSNMGISVAISLGIFIVYWGFLILGEDLADRGKFNPAVAMWLPNIVIGIISYYLYNRVSREDTPMNINYNIFNKNK